jgi:sulfite dehydrogenase
MRAARKPWLLALALPLLAMCLSASAAGAADEMALGKRLFQEGGGGQPACAACHSLKDAGAQGEVGPGLDEIKPDVQRVVTAMRNGIGAMPSFQGKLSDAEIQAVAKYVAAVAGR